MAIIETGSGSTQATVGAVAGMPLHVASKPVPHGALGHFRMAVTSGTIAAALAASAQLFTFRWTHATNLCVIHRVTARFQPLTLFTAATLTDFGFDLKKATSVSAGGGGTAVLPSKMRSTMASSLLASGDARIATTAALTALTTLDTNAIAASVGDTQRVNPAAATEEQNVNNPTLDYWPDVASGEHPLVLSQNEGFVIANRTVWPAAGTGIIQVEMAWAEVTAY
jgi:hypothetical protein